MKLNSNETKSMTLDEQVIACARSNGYKGKIIVPHKKEISGKIEWYIYFFDNDGAGALQTYVWIVTDDMFKQWQRDYKLKQIGV